ncbi:hypothetical protein JRQ81_019141 [Phrynocephalus forsythii]|uniref:Uncharacterized protein n=1 Tax=Phrynocephalus forsythii TaxID=171643 RepID=A0A9Q0XLC8_9SAUR|nr:hypothetical protein JRQ81_019141 [Phrynocephalus forsythii]
MTVCLPKLSLFSNEQALQLLRWMARFSSQVYGLVLAVLGWVFSIISTASEQWRILDVPGYPGIISGRIQIGIWRVCSRLEEINKEGSDWHCHYYMNEHSCLPTEISMAQDLMPLAYVLQSLALF